MYIKVTMKLNTSSKHLILLLLIFLICFLSISCEKEKEADLIYIEKELFKNIDQVYFAKSWYLNAELLKESELLNLRNSIKNGTDLNRLTTDMPTFKHTNNMIFVLNQKNLIVINMLYERESGYLYVSKADVHQTEKGKHKTDINWRNKYLTGVYRFQPGQEFKDFLK